MTLGTVGRAYSVLRRRGLVSGEVGRGSFVRTWALAGSAVVGVTAATVLAAALPVQRLAPFARPQLLKEAGIGRVVVTACLVVPFGHGATPFWLLEAQPSFRKLRRALASQRQPPLTPR